VVYSQKLGNQLPNIGATMLDISTGVILGPTYADQFNPLEFYGSLLLGVLEFRGSTRSGEFKQDKSIFAKKPIQFGQLSFWSTDALGVLEFDGSTQEGDFRK
jgi:hypothetical protein